MKLFHNKIAKNASWIIVGKIIQSVLGFVISMLTARYLGPSNFGLITYAASLVAFVVPIMQLGLNSILVQELTIYPEEEGKIIGTSIVLSLISATFCIISVFLFAFFVNYGDFETILISVLYSLMLVFLAIELIQYWFQAKLLSKYKSIISLVAYIIVSIYKIFLLVTGKSVLWFAISYSIDYFLIAAALILVYKKLGGRPLRFSLKTARRMFSKSKYYIVSSLMIVIFAQTDKIMIKLMIDDASTGYYSAAIVTAGLASFVYSAIIDSFRPSIFGHKKANNTKGYELGITRLYSVIIYTALAQSILMLIFSKSIILLLYGSEYSSSIVVLQVVVWYTTFSYFGGAKDVWVLAENKQKYLIWINMSGAMINILLNVILIPSFGILGAAFASLVTQIFSNIVMMFLVKQLRYNLKLLFRALNPIVIIKMFK